MTKKKIILFGLIFVIFLGGLFGYDKLFRKTEIVTPPAETVSMRVDNDDTFFSPPFHYNPVPISLKTMKNKGCVMDGFLSEYGEDVDAEAAMLNRSECVYLHRSLETWASPPDFAKALNVMQKVTKTDVIYGMFLAENIKKNVKYFYPDENRYFDFSEMCREGSNNAWGEHTCKPNINNKEYRKYLSFVTHRAMDIGIQSFLFGQIYYQDSSNLNESKVDQVLDDMRNYAKKKNMQIVIGAQTGNITNEKYIRRFDFVEGGVGIGNDGVIETGPCWSQLQSCWALLWNDRYTIHANNVFLHLDWSGLKFDDMSSFARMDALKRQATLEKLHKYFTDKNMGFMMPMMATLNVQNGGCYGPKKRFYSASNDYTCKDESVINAILKKTK